MTVSATLTPDELRQYAPRSDQEIQRFAAGCIPPRIRPLVQWAPEEIRVPTGPFANRRLRYSRQPFARLLFAELESRRWRRHAILGPQQSGKSLCGYVIPSLWKLFELGEDIILGVPTNQIGHEKFTLDFLPVIRASRYRDFLPAKGRGSKGGASELIQFGNGATLKLMPGGGGDDKRSAYTSPNLFVTEADKLDNIGGGSTEATKLRQMEGRLRAHDTDKFVVLECTVSTPEGAIWSEFLAGSRSRLAGPCRHCKEWVTPERQHLKGWEDAADEWEAEDLARFHCPECDRAWSEGATGDRAWFNQRAVLLHGGEVTIEGHRVIWRGGQTVRWIGRGRNRRPKIEGELPRTHTLGFRWSAVNNLFVSAGTIGVDEWKAARSLDPENWEKELRQWTWAVPYEEPRLQLAPINQSGLISRITSHRKGEVPNDAIRLTVGVDVGLYYLHWLAIAWSADGSGLVIDYNEIETRTRQLGPKRGIAEALKALRAQELAGFTQAGADDKAEPHAIWCDARYYTDTVCNFVRDKATPAAWLPIFGYGQVQQQKFRSYSRPKSKSAGIRIIGDGYHIQLDRPRRCLTGHLNADQFKLEVQSRLAQPADQAGALTFHFGRATDHKWLIKHLLAETVEEQLDERGRSVRVWKRRGHNHYFDCAAYACAAAHAGGVRVVPDASAGQQPDAWFTNQKRKPRSRRRP